MPVTDEAFKQSMKTWMETHSAAGFPGPAVEKAQPPAPKPAAEQAAGEPQPAEEHKPAEEKAAEELHAFMKHKAAEAQWPAEFIYVALVPH